MQPHEPSTTSLQTKLLFGTALLGILLLALPALGLLQNRDTVSVKEKRRLNPFPKLDTAGDWVAFPQAFEAYFADRFKYRQPLTHFHHRLTINAFDRSPTPKVLISDNGWLFLNGDKGDFVDVYHRNIKPLTGAEISTIHDEMSKRRDWIANWGGKTLFLVVPNKDTIYPERLPRWLQQPVKPGSRFDQWSGIFDQDPSLNHIDLRHALFAAKRRQIIYFRSDSHWNFDGAYVGYLELAHALQRWFPDIAPSTKPVNPAAKGYRGDLAQMLSIDGRFDEQDQAGYGDMATRTETTLKCARPAPPVSGGIAIPEKSEPLVFECNNPRLPSAVVIRDSMAIGWIPLLPDNFRRVVFMFNWFPAADVIEREKPDVVIFENVERTLDQFLYVKLGFDSGKDRAHFN